MRASGPDREGAGAARTVPPQVHSRAGSARRRLAPPFGERVMGHERCAAHIDDGSSGRASDVRAKVEVGTRGRSASTS